MTTNLNANIINPITIAEHKLRTTQINHAAVAASLCAIVLIAILLAPSLFDSFSSTASSFSSSNIVEPLGQELRELGYIALVE